MGIWQRWKAIKDSAAYRAMIQNVAQAVLPTPLPDFERRRVEEPLPASFPPPYPAPSIIGDLWAQRKPIHYLNLMLPDGDSRAIIPLLLQPLLNPGTWTDNDPSAGYVSWAGCQVAHNGEAYEIDDGNTALKFIWWDYSVSPTTFQTSDTAPSIDPREDLLICFNDNGTAKLAFHTGLIQAEMIVAGILKGITAIFGAGEEVTCDDDGIMIESVAEGTQQPQNKFRFVDPNGLSIFEIYGSWPGMGTRDQAHLIVPARGENRDASITLIALASDIGDTLAKLTLYAPAGGTPYADLEALNKLCLKAPTTLTISGGVITATQSNHLVDTEGGAATDDLDTINGGVAGMLLTLSTVSSVRDVVVRNNVDNIRCGADFTLGAVADAITFKYEATTSKWRCIGKENN